MSDVALRLDRLERDIQGNGNPGIADRLEAVEKGCRDFVTREEMKEELVELEESIIKEIKYQSGFKNTVVSGIFGLLGSALGGGGVVVAVLMLWKTP